MLFYFVLNCCLCGCCIQVDWMGSSLISFSYGPLQCSHKICILIFAFLFVLKIQNSSGQDSMENISKTEKITIKENSDSGRRIIGGILAGDKYPWIVFIGPIGGRAIFCTGSLLSPRWVLTASHCLLTANFSDFLSAGPPGNSLVIYGCAGGILSSPTCRTIGDKQRLAKLHNVSSAASAEISWPLLRCSRGHEKVGAFLLHLRLSRRKCGRRGGLRPAPVLRARRGPRRHCAPQPSRRRRPLRWRDLRARRRHQRVSAGPPRQYLAG